MRILLLLVTLGLFATSCCCSTCGGSGCGSSCGTTQAEADQPTTDSARS